MRPINPETSLGQQVASSLSDMFNVVRRTIRAATENTSSEAVAPDNDYLLTDTRNYPR